VVKIVRIDWRDVKEYENWLEVFLWKTSVISFTTGLPYLAGWKTFEAEVKEVGGVSAVRLRELTEGMATIDVETQLVTDSLADRLEELKGIRLEVVEQNANRLKCRVK